MSDTTSQSRKLKPGTMTVMLTLEKCAVTTTSNVIGSKNLAPEFPWVGRENFYRFNLSARNCNEPSEIDSL
jgi:hypothetical protein